MAFNFLIKYKLIIEICFSGCVLYKDRFKAYLCSTGVYTIAPGFVRTDMAQYGEGFALNDIALNQLTEPKDSAPLVALMASGLMDHATGCTVDVNAASYVH
jgi:NAD(P)-dependent dehydrogenase (short-subunit alcohol dehydrogenase family)